MEEEIVKIIDKHGFVHSVTFKHVPSVGISMAYHFGDMVASREYNKIKPPIGDDDRD
jgi:hypothetical protein